MKELDDIFTPTNEWLQKNYEIALATVISTWGSSPRQVGGQMAINKIGEIIGSVSGGCVEASVIHEAMSVIKNKKIKIKDYGVSDNMAWELGLACGGQLKILIQPLEIKDQIINRITKYISKRTPITLKINCNNGKRDILQSTSKNFTHNSFFDEKNNIFYHAISPKPRLYIIGAVHIAQSLVTMSQVCGYDVVMIDPREHFANEKRFPNCKVINDWPDTALKVMDLDKNCHLITLTHDPKIDDLAIKIGLESKIGYIGCLGSKKTHQKRLDRLREDGFSKDKLSLIHAPIGLDIFSKTPEEISISILAELTKYRRTKSDE